VSGWRIRWSSAGRAAAIAAAALAAIAVLPSLLGGSEPPPLPADVGLAPTATPEPVVIPAPPAPARVPERHPRTKRATAKREIAKRAKSSAASRSERRQRRRDPPLAPVTATAPVSPPLYVYPHSAASPEFGFER
jgi:hypothetical protein